MRKIKFFMKNHSSVMASIAMVFSVMAINSRCVCIYHQPPMPDSLQKLKKN